jgi:two-component system OmpR family sensor kinase
VRSSIPIRWRLALTSASLTFVILLGFALVVGQLTINRIRSDFDNQLAASVDDLSDRVRVSDIDARKDVAKLRLLRPDLGIYDASVHPVIRILARSGVPLGSTQRAPNFGIQLGRSVNLGGYHVETRRRPVPVVGGRPTGQTIPVVIQYARKSSDIEQTVDFVRIFLAGGVLGGTLLALIAGLLLSRRAMAPIAALTAAARDIAETRDPDRRVPVSEADDEVAELARTLDEMLRALGASRAETEGMLQRQRQFVADASHELRTPLTSILANLELLAETLDGERGEAASSALRSSRRMRRLVGDLLLLARADARRVQPRGRVDVGPVLIDAVAEIEPLAETHELSVDAGSAIVHGTRDDLHRLALNLIENAIRHTPAGTHVHASAHVRNGQVELLVRDDGPGVPAGIRDQVFERFVRGAGDRGSSSSGLGLSIVRTVAEAHGGSVWLEDARPGACFVVRLPRAAAAPSLPPPGVRERAAS